MEDKNEISLYRAVSVEEIGDFTHVDPFIFKSGTVIISADDLEFFNNSIQELIHKY